MKPNTKITIGILTAVLLLAFIPTYDLVLKDRIDSVDVVVVKPGEEIKKTELISLDKLTTEPRRKQDLVEDVVLAKDINNIIGHDAAELMIGNAMVSSKLIDFDQLIPDEEKGEAIRPITSDMIYAKPGSLRRKDTITIYTISNNLLKEKDTEAPQNIVSSSTPTEDEKKELGLKEPLLTNVKVVYVKDSSNREVMNAEGTENSTDERLDATANISDLEVILNEKDFQLLMQHVIENKEKLYITYN